MKSAMFPIARNLLFALSLALSVGAATAADEKADEPDYGATAPPAVRDSLHTRVAAFYDNFRAGKFRDAEQMVSEDSRDLFYGAKKNRILSYQMAGMGFTEDFKNAKVLVTCQTIIPMMGSEPFDVPLSSEWRWENSDWYMHFKQREVTTEEFKSPFGPMTYKDTPNPTGQLPSAPKRPTLDSLKNMYRADKTELRFPGGNSSEQFVTIYNQAAGPLKIELRGRPMTGMEVVVPDPIDSGTSGRIHFAYTAGERRPSGRHRLEFMVLPINQPLTIYLNF